MTADIVPSELEPGVDSEEQIAPRLSVSQCVAVYEQSVAEIKMACATIAGAEKRLNDTFCMGQSGSINLSVHGRISFDHIEDNLYQMRMETWRAIVDRTEIRRLLSVARAKELDAMLDTGRGRCREDGPMPEISVEAVESLVKSFTGQLSDLVDEAIHEVFDFLRPRRTEYKTNDRFVVGPKVILSHPVDAKWAFRGKYGVHGSWEPQLTALENVFTALDGKGQRSRGYYSDLSNAIKETLIDGNGRGETPYFAFRCFRNGNLHVRFVRLDLLAELNRRAGGRALRPAQGATT